MKRVSLVLLTIFPLFASDAPPADAEPTASPARAPVTPRFFVVHFRLPEGKNLRSIAVEENDREIIFRHWSEQTTSGGKPFEEVVFAKSSGGCTPSVSRDYIVNGRAYTNLGGVLSAARTVCITCARSMDLCETRVSWGSRAVFQAAAESPSAIRMIELLPRKGVKRGVVWGHVDFSAPGIVMGSSHVAGLPPVLCRGFTVCGCDVRVTIRKPAVS